MQIDKFTIAVTDMDGMVAFYNMVFDSNLKAIPGSPFYSGQFAGVELLFCPNFITKIEADKNRIQFRCVVEDVFATVEKARSTGGNAYGERHSTDDEIIWGIVDPDGNSIELVQIRAG